MHEKQQQCRLMMTHGKWGSKSRFSFEASSALSAASLVSFSSAGFFEAFCFLCCVTSKSWKDPVHNMGWEPSSCFRDDMQTCLSKGSHCWSNPQVSIYARTPTHAHNDTHTVYIYIYREIVASSEYLLYNYSVVSCTIPTCSQVSSMDLIAKELKLNAPSNLCTQHACCC